MRILMEALARVAMSRASVKDCLWVMMALVDCF